MIPPLLSHREHDVRFCTLDIDDGIYTGDILYPIVDGSTSFKLDLRLIALIDIYRWREHDKA